MSNYKEFNADMKRLKKVSVSIDKVYEDSKKVFGTGCFESPWYEAMYLSFNLAMELVAEKYGDYANDWISWHIYENDWGKEKMEAGNKGEKLKPIITIRDLWNVMKNV